MEDLPAGRCNCRAGKRKRKLAQGSSSDGRSTAENQDSPQRVRLAASSALPAATPCDCHRLQLQNTGSMLQPEPEVANLTEDDLLRPAPAPAPHAATIASASPASQQQIEVRHTTGTQQAAAQRQLSPEEQVVAAVVAKGVSAHIARATVLELLECKKPVSAESVLAHISRGWRQQETPPAKPPAKRRRKRRQPSSTTPAAQSGAATDLEQAGHRAGRAAASAITAQQGGELGDLQQYTAMQAAEWQAARLPVTAASAEASESARLSGLQAAGLDPIATMPVIAERGDASTCDAPAPAYAPGGLATNGREAGAIPLTFSLDQPNIRIGTSGYSYKFWHRQGGFYPPGGSSKEWAIYTQSFNTVELNAPFHRDFPPPVWDKWRFQAAALRPSFMFIVKCNQVFTHIKKLNVDDVFRERWGGFWDNCKRLGTHLGPLLFQFPANFAASLKTDKDGARTNLTRLEQLAEVLEPGFKYAFEFRHPSWFCEDVYAVCRAHDWALVTVDLRNRTEASPGVFVDSKWMGELSDGTHPPPGSLPCCASWGEYVRFHGSISQYKGAYGQKELQRWAERAQRWALEGKTVFFTFNNTDDYSGHVPSAVADSRTLARCLWPQLGSVAG